MAAAAATPGGACIIEQMNAATCSFGRGSGTRFLGAIARGAKGAKAVLRPEARCALEADCALPLLLPPAPPRRPPPSHPPRTLPTQRSTRSASGHRRDATRLPVRAGNHMCSSGTPPFSRLGPSAPLPGGAHRPPPSPRCTARLTPFTIWPQPVLAKTRPKPQPNDRTNERTHSERTRRAPARLKMNLFALSVQGGETRHARAPRPVRRMTLAAGSVAQVERAGARAAPRKALIRGAGPARALEGSRDALLVCSLLPLCRHAAREVA